MVAGEPGSGDEIVEIMGSPERNVRDEVYLSSAATLKEVKA